MWEKTQAIFLESLGRTVSSIAAVLPAILVLVVLVLAALFLAWGLRALLRRLLAKVAFDQMLRSRGMAAAAAEGRLAPSELVARLVFWSVIALGVLAGLSAFDSSGLLSQQLLAYLPRALAGVAVLILGVVAARALERRVLIGAVNAGLQSAHLLSLGARWLVMVLTFAMGLEQLGVGGSILVISSSILFGGIVLGLSLAVGLGARATVARSLERVFPKPADAPKPGSSPAVESEEPYRHL